MSTNMSANPLICHEESVLGPGEGSQTTNDLVRDGFSPELESEGMPDELPVVPQGVGRGTEETLGCEGNLLVSDED